MTEEKIDVTSDVKQRFDAFVKAYNEFENSVSTEEFTSPEEEAIKKYKLASSEGVNKIKNRKLRFEILRNVVLKLN